jgi:hypothetical protein
VEWLDEGRLKWSCGGMRVNREQTRWTGRTRRVAEDGDRNVDYRCGSADVVTRAA